ncbi:hypothetical protein LINGRAHAP2_LOCUS36862 [Linum grandiflorum]
MPRGS